MNLKHAIAYPAMEHGLVSLRMATNDVEMNKLNEEFANDIESRANLSVSNFDFKSTVENTWNREYWLITVREEIVGYIGVFRDREFNTAGLAIAVKSEYRDGITSMKAMALVIRYLFDVLGIRKIETNCFGFNLRSQKIYGSFLTPEGILRESIVWANQCWDKYLYGMTRTEWDLKRSKVDRLLRIKKSAKS